MRIIDLIIRSLFNDVANVRIFEDKYSARLQQNFYSRSDRMQIGEVTHYIRAQKRVCLSVFRDDSAGQLFVEEFANRIDAFRSGNCRHVCRWLNPEMTNIGLSKIL